MQTIPFDKKVRIANWSIFLILIIDVHEGPFLKRRRSVCTVCCQMMYACKVPFLATMEADPMETFCPMSSQRMARVKWILFSSLLSGHPTLKRAYTAIFKHDTIFHNFRHNRQRTLPTLRILERLPSHRTFLFPAVMSQHLWILMRKQCECGCQ